MKDKDNDRAKDRFVEAGGIFPFSLKQKMLALPEPKRIDRIGKRNRAILQYLCGSNASEGISEHFVFKDERTLNEELLKMNQDERYYRLAFVIGIDLVDLSFNEDGERVFKVKDGIYEMLQKRCVA